MRITDDYIQKDPFESMYYFWMDLRAYFPNLESNHDIETYLGECGCLTDKEIIDVDTEYSSFSVYFRTKKSAQRFLRKLNSLSEIKNQKPKEKKFVCFTTEDYEKLENFLKQNLSKRQYDMLSDLKIQKTVIW